VWLFSYGGLLFDLFVVPALLWRPTRVAAFTLAVVFHLLNAALFTIGVFPWLMVCATAIFFPPDWPRRAWAALRGRSSASAPDVHSPVAEHEAPSCDPARRQWAIAGLLALYASVQLALPMRHNFSNANPSWTEAGHYFAWHMMLRGKRFGVRYYATAPQTGRTAIVDLRPYLTPFQAARFGRDPRLIHQLARKIAADLRGVGVQGVQVRVLALVSLNGRTPQLLIDPRIDLASEPVTWRTPKWVLPLVETLPQDAWTIPLAEWERHPDVRRVMRRQLVGSARPISRSAADPQ
jgi:hypothetical protein